MKHCPQELQKNTPAFRCSTIDASAVQSGQALGSVTLDPHGLQELAIVLAQRVSPGWAVFAPHDAAVVHGAGDDAVEDALTTGAADAVVGHQRSLCRRSLQGVGVRDLRRDQRVSGGRQFRRFGHPRFE